jgi:TolA-binding protein
VSIEPIDRAGRQPIRRPSRAAPSVWPVLAVGASSADLLLKYPLAFSRFQLAYLSQLDSADRQGEAVPEAKITRLNEKIATLREEIQRLNGLNTLMMQAEDKQISLTDPS